MEPAAAIAIIEADLRQLATATLSATRGADWLASALPERVDELETRRREEAARRAPADVPSALVAYTHLYELRRVIESNWDAFAPALGKKRDFQVLMDLVEDYRNAPAHSRELLPFERALLEGIAGLLRTRVVAHVSTLGPDRRHYPVIESIRDGFGNEPKTFNLDMQPPVDTGLTVPVGTVLTFRARGWDAQGRDLLWKCGDSFYTASSSTVGTDVELTYEVTEADVAAHVFIRIYLASSGRFHRHGTYDDQITFKYRVDPPEE